MTIVIHDRASAARALALPLPLPMRAALLAEIALLTSGEHDLTDWTDILLVEPGDDEAAVEREAGFSPTLCRASATANPGSSPAGTGCRATTATAASCSRWAAPTRPSCSSPTTPIRRCSLPFADKENHPCATSSSS